MKKLIGFWKNCSSIVRIAIGLLTGTVLGLLFPQAGFIGIPGTIFIGALKAIAPVLVALLVCSSVAGAGTGLGSRFKTVVLLYMLSTFTAAVCAVFASRLFPVTLVLGKAAEGSAPGGLGEIFESLLLSIVENPVNAVANGNYLGILFWAIVFGFALKAAAGERTMSVINDLSEAVSKTVSWIIRFAPLGILGIMYTNIAGNGLSIFTNYGQLILLLVGTMLAVALAVNPLIVALVLRKNPYPLVFRCLKESGLQAFFTRSSAANIPVNTKLCEQLGLDRDFYSVSIPLGSTVNMDGAAVTITVMTLAAAATLGVTVPLPMAIVLSIVSTLGAAGTSGVAGGSLLLIPMACSLMGIGSDTAMEVVAVGFIIGTVQDSVETALNSSGDVLFTATAEYYECMKNDMKISVFGRK